MSHIALVVSDVDGTLVTHDKQLTEKAIAAVQKLRDAGIGFTITSSRPPVGMRFLVEPLGITLPIGPFNGSSMVDGQLKPIEQHVIPETAVKRAIEVLKEFGVDIWLFTNDAWIITRDDGKYVPHERNTIQHDALMVDDFTPYLAKVCKIVGASPDAPLLEACEAAMQKALGDQAVAVRSQSYYLDITPPGQDKGTFVRAMAKRLGIATDAVATIGDMRNDLAMFKVSGMSVAMGNATDDVKKQATDVTTTNDDEGFAGAIEIILKKNAG
jgi:Cof subfamily protein (haloacid dehalogenase superfamily)